MSRPQRWATVNDDGEEIPLTAAPAYEERDLADEHLPTYGEATAEQRARPPERPASIVIHLEPVSEINASSSSESQVRKNPFRDSTNLLKVSPCLLTPLIALVIGGIVR